MFNFLETYDNVIDLNTVNILRNEILRLPFYYGEVDSPEYQPTGVVHNIKPDEKYFKYFDNLVFKLNPKCTRIQRAYINLFFSHESPHFHDDGDITTCIFYLNPELEIDQGGETQFFVNNNIIGIRSKPGRLVVFDGKILHKATSFRSFPRLTVVYKYFKNNE